jgi:hypothetical protein
MIGGFKVKAPKRLKDRLAAVAGAHDFASTQAVVDHFVERGLRVYEGEAGGDGKLKKRLNNVVDEQGYSSVDELVEHLLLRGLRAYEETDDDPAALQARLRGLGYID